MIKAVILDLDDTLYPEAGYVQSGFKAVSVYLKNSFSITGSYPELLRLFNENKQSVFDRFCLEKGLNLQTAIQMHNIYISHKPDIQLYSDSLPFLDWLRKNAIKIGLITDGRPIQQQAKIDALQVGAFFDTIIITDRLGVEFRKPHPKSFEIARECLDVEYCETVYIGDNPAKDFYIGALYPIKTVQIIRQGYYAGDYYKGVKPGMTIKSLDELKEKERFF